MTTYSLFPSTPGPGAPTAYAGPFLAGVCWQVTSWGKWLNGYSCWVPPGGDTTPQKFALWQLTNNVTGTLIPAGTITSGVLTAGQKNTVLLPTPLQLTAGIPYVAARGWQSVNGFPQTTNQFGAGQPFAAGITNGPLMAYSDLGASAPAPNNWLPQMVFSTATNDPAAAMPTTGNVSSNFWTDVVISDQPPAGYAGSWRLWPNMPVPPNTVGDTATNFTLATEISLAQVCALNNIWFYSPPAAPNLPTETGVFAQASQLLVSGTHNAAPPWSGAAASGWVACPYGAGILLPAAALRAAVANSAGTAGIWNDATIEYFTTGGGAAGIGPAGPLSAPSQAAADPPGQGSFNAGAALAWPGTFDTGHGPSYWVDIEVTPVAAAGPGGQPGVPDTGRSRFKRRLLW